MCVCVCVPAWVQHDRWRRHDDASWACMYGGLELVHIIILWGVFKDIFFVSACLGRRPTWCECVHHNTATAMQLYFNFVRTCGASFQNVYIFIWMLQTFESALVMTVYHALTMQISCSFPYTRKHTLKVFTCFVTCSQKWVIISLTSLSLLWRRK